MYEDIKYETILQRMLDRISSKFDKREGAVIWDTLSPTAIELKLLYIELDNILKEAYGSTASREYLILRCAERGITPYQASCAVLQGVFTPSDIDVMNQRFSLEELNYVVIGKISDGIYEVQCETPGIIGNQYLGTLTPIEYIKGLETAELVGVLIPGEDDEDTEALRQRYYDSFSEKAFGGNIADYMQNVNAIAGVGGCKVKRVWNSDIDPASMIPDDIVTEWYEKTIDTLDPDIQLWLSAVYTNAKDKKLTVGGTVLVTIIDSEFNAASDVLVDTVQTEIDPEVNAGEGYGLAPIGHVVKIQSVSEYNIDVKTSITFDTGYSWDALKSTITNAVEGYFLELRKTWPDSDSIIIRIAQIETRILAITGVIDISGTTLNGDNQNIILGEYEIPVLGDVSE